MTASDTLDVLAIVGVSALTAYLALLALKTALSRRYARAHPEHEQAAGAVTVLQPILSGDPALAAALRHNLLHTSAATHFLWLIDADDPTAQQLAERLCAEHPAKVAVLLCPPLTGNVNPKLVKLQAGLDAVTTEYVAVLDDDTRLQRDNLGKALALLRSCDLYTGLPCYEPGETLWSSLVAHFVNNNSILTYLPTLALLGPLTLNGMYYVLRTATLRSVGGFTPILAQLCDDYALARLLRQQGCVIHQGITPQYLQTTVPGARRYLALMHRWFVFANVLVRDQPLRVQALLLVLLGSPPFLLWLGLLSVCGGPAGMALLLVALAARQLALRGLHRAVFGQRLRFSFAMSLLAELLQPLHFLHALVQRTIRWRTRRLWPLRDGTFEYLADRPI